MRTNTILITLAAAVIVAIPAMTGGAIAPSIVTPTFQNFQGPSNLADFAGEPSIGYNPSTGSVWFQSYTRSLKVTFNDGVTPPTATWVSRTPVTSVFNIDPILFTDSGATPVRTYAGGLNGECSILSYTINDGSTWTQMTNACAGVFDHQSIGGGAWKAPAPAGAVVDRAVYYCAQNGFIGCATSWNGGLTFNNPIIVQGSCGGLHGHIKVGPTGTAILPVRNCGGATGLGVTLNNGLTWGSRTLPSNIPNYAAAPSGFDPSVAITANNTMYYAWQGTNNHPMVAVSGNEGVSWYNVKDLSSTMNPPIVQSTFQSMVAGDNDRAAVAYLGSTTAGNPFASSWNGVWDLYVSYTFDGGSTWTTVKATTDPVQRGWMCAGGVSCGSGRNLLDFMDATIDTEGRVLVGYADGCIGTCAGASGTKAQSTADRGTIARQSGGTTLFSAYD